MRFGSTVARTLALGGLAVAATVALTAPPAAARTFVSLGFGFPLVAGPAYYPPPPPIYYAPPPVYYYPPPAYPPPPVTYAPPPVAYAPPAPAAAPAQCREYQATTMIGGRPQQVTGTACRQADGTWRIIN